MELEYENADLSVSKEMGQMRVYCRRRIHKGQGQQSDRDLCVNGQCLPAVLCGASGDGCWGPVCSVAADGCCTNGDTAVLTEGTTCVQ